LYTPLIPESKNTRIVRLFDTRFIERHNAINVLVHLFKPIIINLQNIQEITRSVSSSASSYLSAMESGKK